MKFQPFCSTEIQFKSKEACMEDLLALQERHIVLVMSESAAQRWNMMTFVETMQQQCVENNSLMTWIKRVVQNPTAEDLQQALRVIGNRSADIIVVIGGGSAIDLAKGISAFGKNNTNDIDRREIEIVECIKNKTYLHNAFIDIIAVPTTAGTGSEVTQWATIWDEQKGLKYSIDAPGLKPKKAIIVPELTLSTPAMITISCGLDAMCQAIEAYWSKHTTPIVREIAHRAIEIIIDNLRRAVEHPDDLSIRDNLCRASLLAGVAFSQTRTTACHSISYPLTMRHRIPHGLAAAITLEAVGNMNRGNFVNDEELFRLFVPHGGIMKFIDKVCDGIITMRLSSFGISGEDIPAIVDNAFTGGRMDNNPVILTSGEVETILRSVL